MAIAVPMINRVTQSRKMGMQGFSWTTLFFGPFPALFRGHFLAFLVIIVLAFLTFGISSIIFAFLYNGWHWNWLISKGYSPVDQNSSGPMINIINQTGAGATAAN
jgi:hypothetical protein